MSQTHWCTQTALDMKHHRTLRYRLERARHRLSAQSSPKSSLTVSHGNKSPNTSNSLNNGDHHDGGISSQHAHQNGKDQPSIDILIENRDFKPPAKDRNEAACTTTDFSNNVPVSLVYSAAVHPTPVNSDKNHHRPALLLHCLECARHRLGRARHHLECARHRLSAQSSPKSSLTVSHGNKSPNTSNSPNNGNHHDGGISSQHAHQNGKDQPSVDSLIENRDFRPLAKDRNEAACTTTDLSNNVPVSLVYSAAVDPTPVNSDKNHHRPALLRHRLERARHRLSAQSSPKSSLTISHANTSNSLNNGGQTSDSGNIPALVVSADSSLMAPKNVEREYCGNTGSSGTMHLDTPFKYTAWRKTSQISSFIRL